MQIPIPSRRTQFFVTPQRRQYVDLIEAARAAAHQGLPASTATTPDDNETTIERQFTQEHIDTANAAASALHDHAGNFGRLAEHFPTPTDLTAIVDTAQTRIEHELTADVDLHRCLDSYNLERSSLLAFKREFGLVHVPKDQEPRIWLFAKLLAIFCLESAGNTTFFAQGNQLGMLGGFFQAAMISAVNVGSGFCVGKLAVPHVNKPSNRLRAAVALAACVAGAIGFNLVAAHYRDALAASSTTLHDSIGGLLRAPLGLSFHSFLMLAVGLIAFGAAVWKGASDDDWFPHYGRRHRQFLSAQDALHSMFKTTKGRLLSHEMGVGHACDETVGRGAGTLEAMSEVLKGAQQLVGTYDAERAQLEGNRNVHWTCYREENKAVRSSPPPAYFDVFEPFPNLVARQPLAEMHGRMDQLRRALDELRLQTGEIKAHGPRRVVALERRFRDFLKGRTALDLGVAERHPDHLRVGDDGREVA